MGYLPTETKNVPWGETRDEWRDGIDESYLDLAVWAMVKPTGQKVKLWTHQTGLDIPANSEGRMGFKARVTYGLQYWKWYDGWGAPRWDVGTFVFHPTWEYRCTRTGKIYVSWYDNLGQKGTTKVALAGLELYPAGHEEHLLKDPVELSISPAFVGPALAENSGTAYIELGGKVITGGVGPGGTTRSYPASSVSFRPYEANLSPSGAKEPELSINVRKVPTIEFESRKSKLTTASLGDLERWLRAVQQQDGLESAIRDGMVPVHGYVSTPSTMNREKAQPLLSARRDELTDVLKDFFGSDDGKMDIQIVVRAAAGNNSLIWLEPDEAKAGILAIWDREEDVKRAE